MTTKPPDDLEAVRAVAAALEGFDSSQQERIIRWAREKLGLSTQISPAQTTVATAASLASPTAISSGKDLKSFVTGKNPKSDVQFAATVAYYYQFETSPQERKEQINSNDLQEACRLATRKRLKDPGQTLRNAHTLGLLDKGAQSGSFTINSVGENLVAMTLPAKLSTGVTATRDAKKRKGNAKRRVAKK
jgi:hypothetical protein